VRGDSGFCRDDLLTWCEAHDVDSVLGLAQNSRLKTAIAAEMAQAKEQYAATQQAARVVRDCRYRTTTSWSCERRVIGKAEQLAKGENPRFVVTSLSASTHEAHALYEDLYCARGEMENRIKEQQLALFADRTSTHEMRSKQLRLYCSSFAYVLIHTLRRVGLNGTSMAKAQCATIRVKLFKIGAQIRISVRRIWIAFSDSYPHADVFRQILQRLQRIPLRGSVRHVVDDDDGTWHSRGGSSLPSSQPGAPNHLLHEPSQHASTPFRSHSTGSQPHTRFHVGHLAQNSACG